MPSVVSLYLLNPMLPALGLLLGALIGLERFLATGHRGWLVQAAILAAAVVQFKAFAAVHLLLGLVLTAAVYGAVFRRWDALAAAAAIALAVAPLLWSKAASRAAVSIDPWPYLPAAFVRMGLAETPLGRLVLAFYAGDRGVLAALGFCAVALPGYLLLSFGPRLVGLAAWARALTRPSVTGSFSFLLAAMVLAGPPLSLALAVIPAGYPGRQYFNNAVWFFVQSKYLMWFFAMAPLSRFGRPAALATAGLLLASSLPSTVQYLTLQAAAPPPLLERPIVETLEFLRRETRPGDICLAREEMAQAILATTRCRAPALGVFAYSALSPEQQDRLQGTRDGFWEAWRRGALEGAALTTLRVDYVIADVSLDGDHAAIAVDGATGNARLDRRFLNSRFAVFKVRASLPS
jgi:hypothetical protein